MITHNVPQLLFCAIGIALLVGMLIGFAIATASDRIRDDVDEIDARRAMVKALERRTP